MEVSWLPQYHDMGLIGALLGLCWYSKYICMHCMYVLYIYCMYVCMYIYVHMENSSEVYLLDQQIGCMYCGGSGYYMSPVDFIKNPLSWIAAISHYKVRYCELYMYVRRYVQNVCYLHHWCIYLLHMYVCIYINYLLFTY